VAELYDRSRPSYPPELVDAVLAFAPTAPAGVEAQRVLEVGPGTGKATVLFAERGASVVGVEPSADMAALARRNCAGFPSVRIEQSEFEGWHSGGQQFEVLTCAQAWHWITPELRMEKAREALLERGALALFWTRPLWDACVLATPLREAYAASAPEFGSVPGPMHPASPDPRASWGDYGRDLDPEHGFAPEPIRHYDWPCKYATGEYLELIQTHSDHIVLAEHKRQQLLAAVATVIDGDGGGQITLTYRTYLWLARRL
jgi:SAM-dependent methyltransferase